jgi:hypothetical protein
MTDDTIRTDYALQREAKGAAIDIFETVQSEHGAGFEPDAYDSEWSDRAHEWADSSQHVIYNYRAIQICANCDTSNGEAFLEDVGTPEDVTFESLAVAIAYGELRARIEGELQEICEEWENPVTEYSVLAHYLPRLINGDNDGLSTHDHNAIDGFEAQECTARGHWANDDSETFIGTCEASGGTGELVTVQWVDMDKVEANRALLTLDPVPVTAPTTKAAGLLFDLRQAMRDSDIPDASVDVVFLAAKLLIDAAAKAATDKEESA